MGEGADRATELAHPHGFPGGGEAAVVPSHFRPPESELHAEGHRLGVDAVRPPHHDGPAMFFGPAAQDFPECLDPLEDQIGGADQPGGERGVHHVGTGEPEVDPASLGPDVFRHGLREGDDVVLDRLFDLVDPGDVEAGPLPDDGGGACRNDVLGRHRLGGGDLHLHPGRELGLVGPDRPISGRT